MASGHGMPCPYGAASGEIRGAIAAVERLEEPEAFATARGGGAGAEAEGFVEFGDEGEGAAFERGARIIDEQGLSYIFSVFLHQVIEGVLQTQRA